MLLYWRQKHQSEARTHSQPAKNARPIGIYRNSHDRKIRNTEHPDAFDPSRGTPGRISGAVLLELLLRIIGKNPRSQGRHIPPGSLIALRHPPGLHPDHERIELLPFLF
jgi:hypothetical protein